MTQGSTPALKDRLAAICAMDAPLGRRLAAYAEALRERGSPFVEGYDQLVVRLASGESGANAERDAR